LRRLVCLLCLLGAARPLAAQDAPPAPDPAAIVDYLNESVAWYRGVLSMAPLAADPAEVLEFQGARQAALEAVRYGFDFARAETALVPAAAAAPKTDVAQQPGRMNPQNLARLVVDANTRAQQAQAELDRLQRAAAAAPARQRATLQRQADEVKSELQLAQARRDTLQALSTFSAQSGSGGASLVERMDALERSVPELRTTTAANAAPAAAPTAQRSSSDRGVLPLFSELFSLVRKQHEIRDSSESTSALRNRIAGLRTPLGADLRATLQQGDQLTQAEQSTDATVLADRTHRIDDITAHFKKVSAALVPLGKQSVLLDAVGGHLAQWQKLVDRQTGIDARALVLRLAILVIGVALLLAASDFWRRATFKYVQDTRRRQQFLLLRRIVVTATLVIFVLFGIASEIGSLATFAGFITAGLAIALQNVILSVVAYFFLIGKYGVRVGDRVQISGVTGDVIDLGLVRLHLMEIGADGQPTGRVVVFSNAVLFQPTANFFKQLPGSNFTWHRVQLTLSPDSDYHLAETRLMKSVESIYAKYRDTIDAQHQRISEDLSVQLGGLKPQSQLRLTEAGLEMIIRFPVPLDKASTVDDEVTRSLLDTIAREPRLKLVGSGTPTIQAAPDGSAAAQPQ
jgi:small-conductance mechanosensitive channel